ncbi:MAG TPA: type 4a pilus biogenesis protein PilO [Actinomycetes bacterium]|nr:type 4a pilus biogenesis protein PilO [Actinomycetes bacterium]
MNRMRSWSLGAAAVAVLVLVAGWFLLVSPARGQVSDLHSQTAAQQQTNTALQTQINQLKVQNKDLPKMEAKLAEIRQHLPANPELPTYIRSLTDIAHRSGVVLLAVTPAQPAPVVVSTPAVVAPTVSASPSASSSTSASPAAVTPATPTTTTASGLKMIPVTVQVTGGYFNLVAFLNKVEGLQRSMLVYAVNVSPGVTNPNGGSTTSSVDPTTKVTATLSTRIFYAPTATPTAPATGTAAAPAAAPAS